MQLKIKRSQKTSLMGSVVFCLDARLELTRQEAEDIKKYKLASQVIYSNERHSQASNALANARIPGGSSTAGALMGAAATAVLSPYALIAALALRGLNLSITFNSLQNGQHIECKSLDEVMGAEQALIEACEHARAYLQTAASFDGRELIIDFAGEAPQLVNV